MPALLFWDIVFLGISLILSVAWGLMVLGVAPKRSLNWSFFLFDLMISIWIVSALLLRLSLWFDPKIPGISLINNPQFWIETGAMALGMASVMAFRFTIVFLERRSGVFNVVFLAGLSIVSVFSFLIYGHWVVRNAHLDAAGIIHETRSAFAWIGILIIVVYLGWSLILFWQERRNKGGSSLSLALLIFLIGFILNDATRMPFPTLSIANMASVLIMGFSILRRQIFNPLNDYNLTLQKEILMRIQTEESLKFSLRDKEVLLQEVHHRVKNNLQVISSLLNLQMARIQDPEQREAFKDSQNRIRSMSLVHELLYQNLDFRKTDYAGYIRSLVLDLLRSYGISTRRIAHEIHVQNVAIPLNKAIPCGLIINELVSNALKYAFPPSFTGKPRLTIRLRALESGQMELTVRDNGVGLPKGFSVKKSDSLGLQLVSMLTEDQLKGRLGIVSRNGTKFIVQFRP